MNGMLFPSGDPLADRRAGFADSMAFLGDFDAAIEVLRSALCLAPGWAAGWFRLGEYLESTGDMEGAASAWETSLAHDPADPFGAGLKRDLARKIPIAENTPAAFVETLFDQYATTFDVALRDRLGYRAPALLRAGLERTGQTKWDRALDLGCGTGLAGLELRSMCRQLEGLDISAGMLREAADKGVYDRLDKADIGALRGGTPAYDLIVAADVFAYLGTLEQVIGWCSASLLPGGILAFTVEAAKATEQDVVLRESRRFAHSAAYIKALHAAAGLVLMELSPCVLRQDRGADVHGYCAIAAAPGRSAGRRRPGYVAAEQA